MIAFVLGFFMVAAALTGAVQDDVTLKDLAELMLVGIRPRADVEGMTLRRVDTPRDSW